MKNYTYVSIECYLYTDMLKIFENIYKADYRLIGYEHDSTLHKGQLVLYPKREEKNQ